MVATRRQFLAGLGGCLCCLRPARADILDTKLEPLVGVNYAPHELDERGIWQSCERIEDAIRHSDRLLRAEALQKYTAAVMERLLARPVPDLRIYLMRDASFNAVMFPTGMMVVHTGFLVRARNEAQFAAVLGHESGHYFRKHTLQQYRSVRRKAATAAVVTVGAGMAAGGLGSAAFDASWLGLANGVSLALMLSVFQYSRDMETEADAFGISLMSRAGYRPDAASEVWRQFIAERRQSAQQRRKRYNDRSDSVISTHPPTEDRMADLADTAEHLRREGPAAGFEGRAEWQAAIAPHLRTMLDEQVLRNDPGASLYLVESLAQDGWTGLLRYQQGEIHRLRGEAADAARAADAYAAAIKLPDAPPEAWRAHGYALLKAGQAVEGREALGQYLALAPDAKDAAMVRYTLSQ
jgi:Zn-dependent protease with chaperone function